MLIGEFARKAGLSPSRIRFYEARGLLPARRGCGTAIATTASMT